MAQDEEFMTIEEASVRLGVARRTLERYTQNGRIRRYRRGMRIYYKRSDVENLAKEIGEYKLDDNGSE